MSPEQASGDPETNHRTDLYSFGCVAYEVLAGQPPFTERSPRKLLAAHMGEMPQPISELRPETPLELAELVMACLAKDPDHRPQRASDLVRVLETVTSGGTQPAMPQVLLGGRGMLRKALLIYAGAFVVVAVVAKAAIIGIGLPDWVFPGALIVMALGLPVILFTGYVHRVTRRAMTVTPTFTPGGTPSLTHGTMATIAMKASPHVSWKRTARGGVYALGAFVLLIAAFMTMRALGIGPAGSLLAAGTLSSTDQILVADFKTSAGDSALSTVLAEAMRTSLGQSRIVRLVPASSIDGALRRMKRSPTARLDLDLAREIAAREGIKAIVTGEATPIASGYVLTARLVAGSTGDVLASFQETADGAKDLIAAVDRLGRGLRGRIGESLRAVHADPPLAQVTTPSLDALRRYADGQRANSSGDYQTAVQLLTEAVTFDTTFASAYRLLGQAIGNTGLPTVRRAEMLEKAYRYRDRMTEPERLTLLGTYYQNGFHADRAKAIAAYEELFSRYPEWTTGAQNLPQAYNTRREYAKAEAGYKHVQEMLLPDERFAFFNILAPQVALGKLAEARKSLALAKERFPQDFRVLSNEGQLLYAADQPDSAQAVWQSMLQKPEKLTVSSGHGLLALAGLRGGRILDWRRHESEVRTINAARGLPEPPLADSLTAVEIALRIADQPDEAALRLDAALARQPLSSIPDAERPYLRVAALYALAGKVTRARAVLAEYDAAVRDTARRRLDEPSRANVQGWLAYADGKYLEAVAEFRRSDMLPDGPNGYCAICIDPDVGRAFDRANQLDSAVAAFEHFVKTPSHGRVSTDALNLHWITYRLAQLYEARGDTAKAAEQYRKFVVLWQHADPELQPRVAEARRHLEKLTPVEKRR
jgi:tetratricopeptide (TPR) repeat protein